MIYKELDYLDEGQLIKTVILWRLRTSALIEVEGKKKKRREEKTSQK